MYSVFLVFLLTSWSILPLVSFAQNNYESMVSSCNGTEKLDTVEGHDPCLLSAALSAACSGNFTIAELVPPANAYETPTQSETAGPMGKCLCSTVAYNAFQACSSCQDGIAQTWDAWKTTCEKSLISIGHFDPYVEDLNPPITIPQWAFIDTSSGTWSKEDAENVGMDGDPSDHKGGGSKPSKAVIGGIVGGIVGVILIITVVCITTCRRRRRKVSISPVPLSGKDYTT